MAVKQDERLRPVTQHSEKTGSYVIGKLVVDTVKLVGRLTNIGKANQESGGRGDVKGGRTGG